MGFCTTCGSRKGENGLCLKCDQAPRSAPPPVAPPPVAPPPVPPPAPGAGYGQQPPPAPHGAPGYGQPPHGHPPHGAPGYGQPGYGHPPHGQPGYGHPPHGGYHQAMRSPFVQDLLAVVKGFFTARPESAFEHVLKMNSHIWLVLGGVYVLLMGFLMMAMSSPTGAPAWVREFIPFGRIFMYSVFGTILLFFLLAVTIKVTSLTVGVQMSFSRVLNVVSTAIIPLIVSLGVALIFSLFSSFWGFLFVSIGSIASFVFLLIAVQRICGRIPLWAVVIGYAIYVIIASIIVVALMASFIASLAGDIGNMMNPFIDLMDFF